MIGYEWNKGAPYTHLDANKIGHELADLRDDGVLQVRDVVEYAGNNPQSELARAFEWDDGRAAHEHRLGQARKLVGAVRHYTIGGGDVEVHRTHFGVGGGTYASVKAVHEHEDYQKTLLTSALRSLQAWRDRYAEIGDVCGVFVDVDAAIDTLKKAEPSLAAAE